MPAARPLPRWPLLLIAAPAAVAIWSGWVGLGGMAGFGVVRPLPGIASAVQVNTAITLPVGVEAYGAFALGAWLLPGAGPQARRFARWSAIGALALGCLGQITYHLLAAAHVTVAPWPIVIAVSCLPIVTLGFGMALVHLLRADDTEPEGAPAVAPVVVPVASPAPLEAVTPAPLSLLSRQRRRHHSDSRCDRTCDRNHASRPPNPAAAGATKRPVLSQPTPPSAPRTWRPGAG